MCFLRTRASRGVQTGTKAEVYEACALCMRGLGLRRLSNRKDKTTLLQSTWVEDVFFPFPKKHAKLAKMRARAKNKEQGEGVRRPLHIALPLPTSQSFHRPLARLLAFHKIEEFTIINV